MTGDKVAKQLERDAAAYRAGFADGYRAAKAEQIRKEELISVEQVERSDGIKQWRATLRVVI